MGFFERLVMTSHQTTLNHLENVASSDAGCVVHLVCKRKVARGGLVGGGMEVETLV